MFNYLKYPSLSSTLQLATVRLTASINASDVFAITINVSSKNSKRSTLQAFTILSTTQAVNTVSLLFTNVTNIQMSDCVPLRKVCLKYIHFYLFFFQVFYLFTNKSLHTKGVCPLGDNRLWRLEIRDIN